MNRSGHVRFALVMVFAMVAVACGPQATPAPAATATPTAENATLTPTPTEIMATPTPEPVVFDVEELKTPHYVAVSVEHGALLEAPPAEISITFNFTLAPPTQLRVVKEGETIVTSNAISEDRLVLSANVPNQGSGIYIVYYDACWPDGSCHQGQFGFAVA